MNLRKATNVQRDENRNLCIDFQSVLNGWKNYFNKLFNVPGVNNVWTDCI